MSSRMPPLGPSLSDVELSPYKWGAHIDRLKALALGRDVLPVTVELDLVDYCNDSCWWCVDPRHGKNALDREFALALLDELKTLGIEGIVFKGGGEPTLHQDFPGILHGARERGFEAGIVTNGTRLPDFYQPIVHDASYLRVSIDGPTPESHKRIHGGNDFMRRIGGVSSAVSLRASLQMRHPVIGLSFAMDASMAGLVGEAIGLGDGLGVDYVLLRPPFFEEAGRPPSMGIEEKKALFSAFEEEKRRYSGSMAVLIDYWISDSEAKAFADRPESPRRGACLRQGANGIEHLTGRCLASPLLAVVAADRQVYPCCNLRFLDGWSIGTLDYAAGDTFGKLWAGPRRKEVLDRIHRVECLAVCTHPMSRYNEAIEYLSGPQHHRGFV